MRALLLTTFAALAAAAAAPVASADSGGCLPRGDGQDLVCVFIVGKPGEPFCLAESVNPPAPGTYQASSTCAPIRCPPLVCAELITIHPPRD